MRLVVGGNVRNIVEASGVAFVKGKFGSFVLNYMWIFFKAMSSDLGKNLGFWSKRENNLKEQLNFTESRFVRNCIWLVAS